MKTTKIKVYFLLTIGILSSILIALFLLNNYRVKTSSNEIKFDVTPPSGIAAHFTLSKDYCMSILPEEEAVFDMGSRHSLVCKETLQRIAEKAIPHRISSAMIYTKDVNGNHKLYTKKLIIDIALPNPECPDSVYRIHNVDFLIDDTITNNVLGMNVLKHFAIKRLFKTNEILLYFDAPNHNYQEVCELKLHESILGSLFGNEVNRASVSLSVNGETPHCYFMDTGQSMRTIEVVQPEYKIASATGRVHIDSITGMITQKRCKVKFGNRLRFSRVIYENDLHTDKYGMNPFKFFNQDCIIDIPNRRLLIRKPEK